MKPSLSTLCLFLIAATSAFAQETSPVRCVVTQYRLRAKEGKPISRFEFSPKIAEEELTTKSFRLSGSSLFVVASVFPTDESMHSAGGADSLRLGLAVSRKREGNAFAIPNNAVAEVTFHAFDTARVEKLLSFSGKTVVRLECWDPQREKHQ